ncbi:MAG: prolyl oligopeptidase family serine peptidase, partial [archaeon]|nr:prolyl oligopeptidase family serine peptidase [archaeon]
MSSSCSDSTPKAPAAAEEPKGGDSLLDSAISMWQQLSGLRMVSGGLIVAPRTEGLERDNHDVSFSTVAVELSAKQAVLPRAAYVSYSQTVAVSPSSGVVLSRSMPTPTEGDRYDSAAHRPTGRRAVLRQSVPKGPDDKTPSAFVEVWTSEGLQLCFEALDGKGGALHGPVFRADTTFSGLEFSPDGSKLVYVAEALPAKSAKWHQQAFAKEPSQSAGRYFEYQDHWGEQQDGARLSRLFVADLASKSVSPVDGIDPGLCCADPQWTPSGDGLVFVGYDPLAQNQRRLGLVYCTNRPSALYLGKFAAAPSQSASPFTIATTVKLSSSSAGGVRNPRFSPSGTTLIFLDTCTMTTHNACNRLLSISWEGSAPQQPYATPTVVVDAVAEPVEELPGPAMIFPGLFCSGLVAHPWLNDSEILLSSLCRSKQFILKVDVQTHLLQIFDPFLSDHVEATSGDPHHSLSVSDVWSPYVLFTRSSFSAPPTAFLSSYHDGVVSWTSRLTPHQPAPCDGAKTQLLTFTPSGQSSSLQSDSFEAFLVTSPSSTPSSSLIVLPHGGPHGTFVPYFSVTLMTFLLSGYDLFFVNYRGSLGFGQRSVESLPGFIGINDVADVYQATQQVQSAYKSLFVHGGSHGGFLAGHLVG